jgi:hypothetical protein
MAKVTTAEPPPGRSTGEMLRRLAAMTDDVEQAGLTVKVKVHVYIGDKPKDDG